MIKYKNTQYGLLMNLILILSTLLMIILYKFQLGSNPIPLVGLIIVLSLLILTLLFFYKLTIIIDKTNIIASFGIGIIKRSMPINDIDFATLEKVKPSIITGIGIRLTAKGWLWNVKFGNAIYFKNKNKTKTFFVGTEDYETIVKILRQ